MAKSTDHGTEANPPEAVDTRVHSGDIVLEKSASLHHDEAVAVRLTLKSSREGQGEVRVVDSIPEALQDHDIEFHPKYDPEHWSRTDEAVVYEVTLNPSEERQTVYGVLIDDPSQLELFDTEPTLDVVGLDDVFRYWSEDASDGGIAEADSNPTPQADDGSDTSPADEESTDPPADSEPDAEPATDDQDADTPKVIEPPADHQIESLRAEVQALHETVTDLEQQLAESTRIETELDSLATDFAEHLDEMSARMGLLEEEVERGARWRTKVQESLAFEPDED